MEIAEQLITEASERAGSPQGMLKLLQLILQEAERMDFTDGNAQNKYLGLLYMYIRAKRILNRHRNSDADWSDNLDTFFSLFERFKNIIKEKRKAARAVASQFGPEELKVLNKYAGTRMNTTNPSIPKNLSEGFRRYHQLS
jgi:hypothetical protein